MEFFIRIRSKLRAKNLLWTVVFFAVGCSFAWVAITNGFSSEAGWRYGVVGSQHGIPVSNWVVSALMVLMTLIFGWLAISHFRSFLRNEEYQKLLAAAEALGNPEQIGQALAALPKCPYTKGGDLRYNGDFLFYMKDTKVYLQSTASIQDIRTRIASINRREENYVCIHCEYQALEIKTSEKNVIALLEDLKHKIYARERNITQ